MRTIRFLLILFLLPVFTNVQITELEKFLKSQPAIQLIERNSGNNFFNETFQIMVRRPLYHLDRTKGLFLLGYYGYDTKPFKKYMVTKSAKNYMQKIFLPNNLKIKYAKETALQVKEFIDITDKKMLFIYGQFALRSA